jgi:hypothetical protein
MDAKGSCPAREGGSGGSETDPRSCKRLTLRVQHSAQPRGKGLTTEVFADFSSFQLLSQISRPTARLGAQTRSTALRVAVAIVAMERCRGSSRSPIVRPSSQSSSYSSRATDQLRKTG